MTDDLTTRINRITNVYEDIRTTAQQVVVSNQPLIEEIFISMISGGHLLIEGVPGTAKTTVCKIVAPHRYTSGVREPWTSSRRHHRPGL
jgi:MoxR-like ATPase